MTFTEAQQHRWCNKDVPTSGFAAETSLPAAVTVADTVIQNVRSVGAGMWLFVHSFTPGT